MVGRVARWTNTPGAVYTVRPFTRTPNPQPAQCVRDLLSYVNEVDSIGIPFLRRRRFAAMSQFTAQSSTRAAKFSFRDAPEDAPDQFTGKVFISTVPRTPDRRTHRCKFNTAERVLPVGISYSTGRQAVLAAVESVAVFVRVCVVGFGWMVVRFVRVIRLPACARVSRVSRCVSRLPPVSFYRYCRPVL